LDVTSPTGSHDVENVDADFVTLDVIISSLPDIKVFTSIIVSIRL